MSLENANAQIPEWADIQGSVATAEKPRHSKPSKPSHPIDWARVGGSVVITGMVAAAVVIPGLSHSASADTPEQSRGQSDGTSPIDEESWANLSSPELVDTGDLSESAAAASRARLRAPVVATSCLSLPTAANGSRSFTETSRVYLPLREGSYVTSSPYGYRFHPITGAYKLHEGTDMQAPAGTPIYAVAEGTVTFAGYDSFAGYKTVIQHVDTDGSMVETWYFHQSAGSQLVSPGDYVQAGQQIGSVGSTGASTGAHLHLEVHPGGGDSIDPIPWLDAHQAVFLGQECS